MYYEETFSEGRWYWRSTPDGAWELFSIDKLCTKIEQLQAENAREPIVEEDLDEQHRVRCLSDESIVGECADASHPLVVRELANRYDVVCEKLTCNGCGCAIDVPQCYACASDPG